MCYIKVGFFHVLIPPETEVPMNISPIIQLLQTPTCVILALTILVLVSGFVLKNLYIEYKDLKIKTKSKKKKHKK